MIDKEMAEKTAQSAEVFSKPIDFGQLLKDGLVIQRGKSYYAPNLHASILNSSEYRFPLNINTCSFSVYAKVIAVYYIGGLP